MPMSLVSQTSRSMVNAKPVVSINPFCSSNESSEPASTDPSASSSSTIVSSAWLERSISSQTSVPASARKLYTSESVGSSKRITPLT